MTISQTTVRGNRSPGIIGGVFDISQNNEEIFFINADPQAKQKDTITVNTATANADFELNVNGADIVYTSPATGQTATTIAAGIAVAVNANPLARAQVVATSSAAVVTLESASPSVAYTVSHSDGKLGAVTSVTTAKDADAIGYGLLCISSGVNQEIYDNRLGRLASADGLSKTVITLDVDGTDVGVVSLRVNGAHYTKTGVIATLRTELDSIDGITVTGGTTKVIITGDAGADVQLTGLAEATIDSQTDGDNINDLAIGVSKYNYATGHEAGQAEFDGNAGVTALKRGRIWVECNDDVTEGNAVFVGMTGTEKGKFFASYGSGRIALDKNKCRFDRSRSADGLAVINCNF